MARQMLPYKLVISTKKGLNNLFYLVWQKLNFYPGGRLRLFFSRRRNWIRLKKTTTRATTTTRTRTRTTTTTTRPTDSRERFFQQAFATSASAEMGVRFGGGGQDPILLLKILAWRKFTLKNVCRIGSCARGQFFGVWPSSICSVTGHPISIKSYLFCWLHLTMYSQAFKDFANDWRAEDDCRESSSKWRTVRRFCVTVIERKLGLCKSSC